MNVSHPIHSILLATDLQESSDVTIQSAAQLAAASGAKLHVIHAHEEPSRLSQEPRDLLYIQRQVHDKRKDLLEIVNANTVPGTEIGSVRVEVGPAAQLILDQAKAVLADVIVLGAHQHRGMADRFLGSTAELVLRNSTTPCLVLNGPVQTPIARILVPSDFSAPARRAITTALAWGQVLGGVAEAEITVAHVLDPGIESSRQSSAEKELEEDLRFAAADASRTLGVEAPVRVQVLRGEEPAEELIGYARAIEADLIVLGTHGDTMFVRALMGSVSSVMVRRSPVPVLLVPRAAGILFEAQNNAAAEEQQPGPRLA
jgi:nucleotide-binding universal stress UspA family protein